jgi:hypothetical protein
MEFDDEQECPTWCDCGHLHINHEYLTLREMEALKAGDIELGYCQSAELTGKSSEGEVLTYVWVEFKVGQDCDTIEAILHKLDREPEDPCDTAFMKDISS